MEKFLIQGTVSVRPDLAQHIAPDDRLVIKLFHPGADGAELDAKLQLVPAFSLPLAFKIAPAIGMSGDTKYQTYQVEAFTDKDGDVLSVVPGELLGRTPAPVRLGTSGIQLELNTYRAQLQ